MSHPNEQRRKNNQMKAHQEKSTERIEISCIAVFFEMILRVEDTPERRLG
nr:hypothetical protein Iba_chr12bCG25870 [Ipomoea batatas]